MDNGAPIITDGSDDDDDAEYILVAPRPATAPTPFEFEWAPPPPKPPPPKPPPPPTQQQPPDPQAAPPEVPPAEPEVPPPEKKGIRLMDGPRGEYTADDVPQLREKGNTNFARQRYVEAEEWYSAAIDLAPADHQLYSNRSAAYAKLEQWGKALSDARQATRLAPRWAKGYIRKGVALRGVNDLDGCARAYRKATELEPENTDLAARLAQVEELRAKYGMDYRERPAEDFEQMRARFGFERYDDGPADPVARAAELDQLERVLSQQSASVDKFWEGLEQDLPRLFAAKRAVAGAARLVAAPLHGLIVTLLYGRLLAPAMQAAAPHARRAYTAVWSERAWPALVVGCQLAWDAYALVYRATYPFYHQRVRPRCGRAAWWVQQKWPRFKHLVLKRGWRHASAGAVAAVDVARRALAGLRRRAPHGGQGDAKKER